MFVCVGGNSGAVVLGEIWCDYEVEFMTPQIDSNYAADSAVVRGVAPLTGPLPFGNAIPAFGRNNLFSFNAATSTYTFLQNYQCIITWTVVGTVLSAPLVSGTSTIVGSSLANAGGTALFYVATVRALAGQTLIFTLTATTITTSTLGFGAYAVSLLGTP
jgi:hypothetical protein